MPTTPIDYNPKLRIFFSVDVIGSTAFKNISDDEKVQPWLRFFHDFYDEFKVLFNHYTDKAHNEIASDPNLEKLTPDFWKSLGDELLFQNILTHHEQASILTVGFKRAIEEFNRRDSVIAFNLAVKGAVWVAGFPVVNAELFYDEKYDFIGPTIDIGFRLAKFSTNDKLIVSLELALILNASINNHLKFFYEGKHVLKGVLGNIGYPIISIFLDSPSVDQTERDLINSTGRTELDIFIKKFLNENNIPAPFIDGDKTFGTRPKDYDKKLEKLKTQSEEPGSSDVELIPNPEH